MVFLVFIISLSVYGSSVYIEPLAGWTLTPMHRGSSALQKHTLKDRMIIKNSNAEHLSHYARTSCWVREKDDGYYFCAIKSGVLFELKLASDNAQKWCHLSSTFDQIKEFAEKGGDRSFCDYWCEKFDFKKCDSILSACKSAVRDLCYKQTEPENGGWNFVFGRNGGLFDRWLGDLAGGGRWLNDAFTPMLSVDGGHVGGYIWMRYCGERLYVYGKVGKSLVVYDLQGDKKHWKHQKEKLDYLEDFAKKGGVFEDRFSALNFTRGASQTLSAIVYGVGGERVDHLLEKSLPFANHQPGGWSVTPLHRSHRQAPPTELSKNPNDCLITGEVDFLNIFKKPAIWLKRGDDGKNSLCAWQNDIYYRYDNVDDNSGWRHLPETLKALQQVARSDSPSLDVYYANDREALISVKNGCVAAVRDCPWRAIEMEPEGCSLIVSPWGGVFEKNEGDIVIDSANSLEESREYNTGSIWIHLCAGEYFLRAIIEEDLFQCRIFDESSVLSFEGFPEVLTILKKICVNGFQTNCLTLRENLTLNNGCIAAICKALYGKNCVQSERGWIAEKPHEALFAKRVGDYILKSRSAHSMRYDDEDVWWRFDGQEALYTRHQEVLLRYNLSSKKCTISHQQNVFLLMVATNRFFASNGQTAIDLEPMLTRSLVYMGGNARVLYNPDLWDAPAASVG